MPITRAFKSGNSQAVRIPADIAYKNVGVDLNITRLGDVITIMPAQTSFEEALLALRNLPKAVEAEEREPLDVPERGID